MTLGKGWSGKGVRWVSGGEEGSESRRDRGRGSEGGVGGFVYFYGISWKWGGGLTWDVSYGLILGGGKDAGVGGRGADVGSLGCE